MSKKKITRVAIFQKPTALVFYEVFGVPFGQPFQFEVRSYDGEISTAEVTWQRRRLQIKTSAIHNSALMSPRFADDTPIPAPWNSAVEKISRHTREDGLSKYVPDLDFWILADKAEGSVRPSLRMTVLDEFTAPLVPAAEIQRYSFYEQCNWIYLATVHPYLNLPADQILQVANQLKFQISEDQVAYENSMGR